MLTYILLSLVVIQSVIGAIRFWQMDAQITALENARTPLNDAPHQPGAPCGVSDATQREAYDWTDEDPGSCVTCGQPWELLRPGKSQPTCDC